MSIRRRSTVHDLASLRLHPDGSRVQPRTSGARKTQPSRGSTHGGRLTRRIGPDADGNRIALDAGGSAAIKQRRSAAARRFEELDEEAPGRVKDNRMTHQEVDTLADPREGSQPRRRTHATSGAGENASSSDVVETVKGQRAKKRRKFYEDFSFLSDRQTNAPGFVVSDLASISDPVPPSQHVIRSRSALSQTALPVPSSDLLKFIHHFASEYYAACGCLFNAPKEAREAVKLRKLAKLRKAVARKAGQRVVDDDTSGLDSLDASGSDSGSGEKGSGNKTDRTEVDRRDAATEHEATGSRKRRKRRSKETPRRDMYKAFDGSALMAIGMLLQEYTAELLSAEVPEDWLRQMEVMQSNQADGVRGNRIRKKIKHENLGGMTQAEEHNGSGLVDEIQNVSDWDAGDNAASVGSSSDRS